MRLLRSFNANHCKEIESEFVELSYCLNNKLAIDNNIITRIWCKT